MKKIYATLLLFSVFTLSYAQSVYLKNKTVSANQMSFDSFQLESNYIIQNFESYAIIIFNKIPIVSLREEIKPYFDLIQPIPDFGYYVKIKNKITIQQFNEFKIRHIEPVNINLKIDSILYSKNDIEFAIQNGNVKVIAHYFDKNHLDRYKNDIQNLGFTILYEDEITNSLEVELPYTYESIQKLAYLPYIYWIEPTTPPMETNNYVERTNHRVPLVGELSSYGLTGNGIRVGEWDGTGAGPHIDYDDRHTLMEPFATGVNGNHATHVAGTVLGAGIRNPNEAGMAPEALLFSWNFAGNIPQEMNLGVRNQGIEITQNSYGPAVTSDPCTVRGSYTGASRNLDQLVNNYPNLLHVFAAGNSRSSNCMTGGYGTVHSNFQAAKNNLVVAAVTRIDGNSSFHCYGPVRDGRLKPEISAVGVNVYSTFPFDNYRGGYNGTSMACPGTSGTAALLYEYYKNRFNEDPEAHLMKGVLCNGADDIGRPGPDYQYGFGRLNAYNALKILDNDQYRLSQLSQGNTFSDSFSISAGVNSLKVFLAWSDTAGASSASKALVNDLDLILITPVGDTIYPLICNPASPTQNAIQGVDTFNNTEQIMIVAPDSGLYQFRVIGSRVFTNSQKFSVNWDVQDTQIRMVYPNGGEVWNPPVDNANARIIRWDNYGLSGTATIAYSVDSGQNWTNISNVNIANRQFTWNNCPSTVRTNRALIRITLGTLSTQSENVFTIAARSANPTGVICDQQVHLRWNATSGAQSYKIWQSINGKMQVIDSTTNRFYTVRNLNNGDTCWFSVSAVFADNVDGPRSWGMRFIMNSNNTPPRFTNTLTESNFCIGGNLDYRPTVTATGTPNFMWQFSTDDGENWINTGNTTNRLSLNNLQVSFDKRLYRLRAINVCESEDFSPELLITVDSPFTFSYVNNLLELCIGQDSAAYLTTSNGKEPGGIQWYFQRQLNHSPLLLTGQTSVRLPINNPQIGDEGYFFADFSNGCGTPATSQKVELFIRPQLQLDDLPNDTLCVNQLIDIPMSAQGGDFNNYTFGWKFLDDNWVVSPSVQFRSREAVSINYFVYDNCSEDTIVKAKHFPILTPMSLNLREVLRFTKDTVCAGQSIMLEAAISGGRSYTYQYQWNEGLNPERYNTFIPPKTTNYIVTVGDQCTDTSITDSIKIFVREPLSVSISNPIDTLCFGEPYILTAQPSGGRNSSYNLRWFNNSFQPTIDIAPTQRQTYWVELFDNCTVLPDRDSITIEVRDPITVQIIGEDTICQGSGGVYEAIVSGGRQQSLSYFWNNSVGTSTHHYVPTQSDILRLRVEDGCTPSPGNTQRNIQVREPLRLRILPSEKTICKGQSHEITPLLTGGKFYNYSLTTDAGINNNGTWIVTPEDTTTFNYNLSDGCTTPDAEATVTVNIRPSLSIDLGENTQLCKGDQFNRNIIVSGGLASGYKLFVDDNRIQGFNFSHRFMENQTFNFRIEDDCTVEPAEGELTLFTTDFSDNVITLLSQRNKELVFDRPKSGREAFWQLDDLPWESENGTYDLVAPKFSNSIICKREIDNIGCEDTVCMDIRIFDVFQTGEFKIEAYPNPTNDIVNIRLDDIAGNVTLMVFDLQGRALYHFQTENYDDDIFEISLKDQAAGVYIIKIQANQVEKHFKVVKDY